MQYSEGILKGAGGVELYTQSHEVESPKAAVMILHGYCEHSQRYAHVVDALVAQDFNCYLIDHRGHGRSQGQRAAVMDFEEYLQDIDLFFSEVKKRFVKGPLFLVGHSMGGLIAATWCLKRHPELKGVLLSSPYLGLKVKVPVWKETMGRLLSKVLPKLSMASEIDPHLLTHDAAIVEEYISDEMVPKVVNARWFVEASDAQVYCLQHAAEWSLPLCLLHGGDDRIADPQTSREFFNRINDSNKKLEILEGLYHEIFNEIDRERVIELAITWFNEQL